MSDNTKRALRTVIQVVLGVLATGGLSKVWESFILGHPVDPTIQVAVGLILTGIVTWAQGTLEDNFGGGVLVPEDRVVGDAVLGRGIGAKRLASGRLNARQVGPV